ncbi:glycosyltransferase family 2 protein [Bradyrhizobium genosp. SA-3]|uniref:glycosyltransferase family 2 protein n=1 Tax=Bradyrhizobium genosp. SA-3 TaxID=508868 RepID=UPI0024C0CBBF|nr:glycosyltransferase family 2 protein [Bradyrhizobium genosp. SA-3]
MFDSTGLSRPFITIAIPTYNRAMLLKECLRSALAQTYPHFEVLVLDNASTDDTSKVLRGIQDKKLRVVTQEKNVGLIPNWNSCLAEARGDYVVFVSDDDQIAPHFLQRCVALINLEADLPIVVALSDIFMSQLHRNVAAIPNSKLRTGIWPGKHILVEFFKRRIHTNICTILLATREFRARGGFSSEFACATDMAASLPLLLSDRAGFVNETCGFHSVHDTSATSGLDLDIRLADDQKVVDLIARTVECSKFNPEERKLLVLEGRRWAARNVIFAIAEIRRRGAPLATAMHEIWQWHVHLYCLGFGDILRLARPLAIIALPRQVTASVARVKNAMIGRRLG